ncbi:micronuclear linker histone polyprotein-like [Montipora capricornis]|uniref:micronuclear linker histone polyprotein-like n=1 Tax=Montipora capricornis TaxID=246305 RepID=UPI0035F21427
MSQTFSSLNRGRASNFYSAPSTPTCSSSSSSRASSINNRLNRSSSSSANRSSDSTPLSSRENRETMQQVIAGLAACQRTVKELLQSVKSSNERIEKLTDKANALDDKVKTLSRTDLEDADESSSGNGRAKERKRPKSFLVVQEEVHKLHNSRDTTKQYREKEVVSSVHNKKVTQLIVEELCRQPGRGFARAVVEKTAKKYHEHIRRSALGKITDEIRMKKRINLRKERKYERRKCQVKDEKEAHAFSKLTKEHMSTDDDANSSEGEEGWVSRPPSYRSQLLTHFLNKLDKRYQKAESSVNKRWKRTNARQGEKSEKEPPNGTPKWALSDEWKALLEQRKEEAQRNDADSEEEEDAT